MPSVDGPDRRSDVEPLTEAGTEPVDPAPERWADVVPFRRADRTVGLRDLIGDVLREERHRQGRTLADVAEAAAVSLPYLSEVERGRKDVSSELLGAMHEALGLELSDVLDRAARVLEARSQSGNGFRMLAA